MQHLLELSFQVIHSVYDITTYAISYLFLFFSFVMYLVLWMLFVFLSKFATVRFIQFPFCWLVPKVCATNLPLSQLGVNSSKFIINPQTHCLFFSPVLKSYSLTQVSIHELVTTYRFSHNHILICL